MAVIYPIQLSTWGGEISAEDCARTITALEAGHVLYFPHLSFLLTDSDRSFLTPEIISGSKNVSYDPATGKVGGANVEPLRVHQLRLLLDRFATATRSLIGSLLTAYQPGLRQGKTSLRPVEVAGRRQSWRKDDTRLHVDSFPSQPSGGRRILRVFSNVNALGRPRVWKLGDEFAEVARRFWPVLRGPLPGERALLTAVRITKGVRSQYDHYMLKLHDAMKWDNRYQAMFASATYSFPAGSTWICFTDQVPHAAVSGAHQFEQTFWVDVGVLRNPESAPLRVLESLAGRRLV